MTARDVAAERVSCADPPAPDAKPPVGRAGAVVEGLCLSIGGFRLNGLDFALGAGEVLVILGPNGCGKSVTLETVAGFHRPDAGRVLIGGRDVTSLPPERRKVGFLVQNFGLFPHLNVEQNVAIALRAHRHRPDPGRSPASLPRGDVGTLLGQFGVAHLARRSPQALSPGEKQRVALARAVAAEAELFLFDEPFSALDTNTREHLRDELLSFLRGLSASAIFVTHDRAEAAALADRIVVMRDGTIAQAGPPDAVFRTPADTFVARFVGIENILEARSCHAAGAGPAVAIDDHIVRVAPDTMPAPSSSVHVSIPAEAVVLRPPGLRSAERHGANRLEGRVVEVRVVGPLAAVEVACGFRLKAYLLARQVREMGLGPGAAVVAEVAADAIHVMAS